jgi:Protein phosphatase 2C
MWEVIGASVTGTSHLAAGRQCEDASGWRTEPGVSALAVADGAGSRPLSGRGAVQAVERALELAGSRAAGADPAEAAAWLREIFSDVREQIAAMAASAGNGLADYATTLAVAILTADTVCIGQVGDTIAVIGQAGTYQTPAPAPHAEYVNETAFITGEDALRQLRITVLAAAEVDAIFLSTDGLRFKILDDLASATPYVPFFDDVTAYLRSPQPSVLAIQSFLESIDDQSGDDKSLVVAVRAERPRAGGIGADGSS